MKTVLRVVAAMVMAGGMLAADSVLAGPKGPSIVDVAVAVNSEGEFAGEFDLLIYALGAADPAVLETLDGNGQHTVFAPINAAFENIDLFTTNDIAQLPQDFLTDVLVYHVAKGRRDSEQVIDSSRIRTLFGDFLLQNDGILTDNLDRDANIIEVDIPAANGIIHAIDAVVLPYLP